jgi:hypothetical protein
MNSNDIHRFVAIADVLRHCYSRHSFSVCCVFSMAKDSEFIIKLTNIVFHPLRGPNQKLRNIAMCMGMSGQLHVCSRFAFEERAAGTCRVVPSGPVWTIYSK